MTDPIILKIREAEKYLDRARKLVEQIARDIDGKDKQ